MSGHSLHSPIAPSLTEAARRDTLSAAEAAHELGVKKRTLYAYVSRGLIPSQADPSSPRQRRYSATAVRRLKAYRSARRDPAFGARAAARDALAWGEPVLESAITLITPEGLHYRGHDALELSARCSFEQVAELLWTDTGPVGRKARWPSGGSRTGLRPPGAIVADANAAWRAIADAGSLAPITAAQAMLPLIAAIDPGALDREPSAVVRAGRYILELLTLLAAGSVGEQDEKRDRGGGGIGSPVPKASIAERLAEAWSPRCEGASSLLDTALILIADHELNAAALAARVVASTSGSPYAVVAAGLAALEGTGQGGDTAHIQALLDEAATVVAGLPDTRGHPGREAMVTTLRRMIRRRRRRGERISGFGHRLYPCGDPRARCLLDRARAMLAAESSRRQPAASTVEVASALAAAVHAEAGDHPTVDYALAVVGRAIGAPVHAPLTLFALGRSAGFIAHAMEQYEAGRVLRARARYVGPPIGGARRVASETHAGITS